MNELNWGFILIVLGTLLLLPILIKLRLVITGFIKPNEFLNNPLEILSAVVGITLWIIFLSN